MSVCVALRLLDEPGVGPIVAAQLIVAWSATPPACSSATSPATSTGYCNRSR